MKILLLHPDHSPETGSWRNETWDLVVDLGRTAESSIKHWEQHLKCPVLRLESFRREPEDYAAVRRAMNAGGRQWLDEEGIDWWKLLSILIHAEIETALLLTRLAPTLPRSAQFFGTKSGWPIDGLAFILGCEVRSFGGRKSVQSAKRIQHYAALIRNFSFAQLTDICLDKYDADYVWRSRFAKAKPRSEHPVVLLPSAYTNVSRMAAEYAGMLPDQEFLLVTTRRSGTLYKTLPNVSLRHLASYAGEPLSLQGLRGLLEAWQPLNNKLQGILELKLLSDLGRLDSFPLLLRRGMAVRNAWRRVLEREPVQGVFCGDDSNPFTRLPVLLARNRGIPTLDFHHGALDSRFLFKDLPSDLYLAKSQMERDYLLRICQLPPERVSLGAPSRKSFQDASEPDSNEKKSILFFSEPYEATGLRSEEIYRELLPPLYRLARVQNLPLIVKLHPFENANQRKRLVQQLLGRVVPEHVRIVSGPLSGKLLSRAWFGLTVQSTTAIDCTLQRLPCFLCGWVVPGAFGYAQQYARFGAGISLSSAAEIEQIPQLLAQQRVPPEGGALWAPIEAVKLHGLLLGRGKSATLDEQRA